MELVFRPCRSSSASKLGRYAALVIYPLVSVLLFLASFSLFVNQKRNNFDVVPTIINLVFSIGSFFLALFFLNICRKSYLLETRKIALGQFGFVIKDKKENRYTWRQISCIGIVTYAANASKQIYQTQLCIFFSPISLTELKKLSESYLFGVLNLQKFILMDCDPLLLEEVNKFSGHQILDYRQIKTGDGLHGLF